MAGHTTARASPHRRRPGSHARAAHPRPLRGGPVLRRRRHSRAEEARVPETTSRLLGVLARRYALVACVSGRSASEARRLVGVGGIAYAGAHGAELIEPGAAGATVLPEFAGWTGRIRQFAADR